MLEPWEEIELHEIECEKRLKTLNTCEFCGEKIQDEGFDIGGTFLHTDYECVYGWLNEMRYEV